MTDSIDDAPGFGLGQIDSPPDELDWPIDSLYALTGAEPLAAPPQIYTVPPPFPPLLNQHATPMCVAYSSALLKGYEDLRDTGPATFDEPTFFRAIGGTANGAIIRNALGRLVSDGYPVVAAGQAARHRISSYFVVPVTKADIQSAIASFGPIVIGTPWFNSWFRPVAGVLPREDYSVGGHAIAAIGWDGRGLRLRNSWGAGWSLGGDCFMPWSMVENRVREAWKAADQVLVPPPAFRFRIHSMTSVYRKPEGVAVDQVRSGSGTCRKAHVNGHLWLQIARPTTPGTGGRGLQTGRWLHAGPSITVSPIAPLAEHEPNAEAPAGVEP